MHKQVTKPTLADVQTAIDNFDKDNALTEAALQELFRTYPTSEHLPGVYLKVIALNCLYSTQIPLYRTTCPALEDMANHIWQNAAVIDKELAAGSPAVVGLIAKVSVDGLADRTHYSFATKYCSWHESDSFPISDSRAHNYLYYLQKEIPFTDVRLTHDALYYYPTFLKVMKDFREAYGLEKFKFKHLDKFLWTYGEILNEVGPIDPSGSDPVPSV